MVNTIKNKYFHDWTDEQFFSIMKSNPQEVVKRFYMIKSERFTEIAKSLGEILQDNQNSELHTPIRNLFAILAEEPFVPFRVWTAYFAKYLDKKTIIKLAKDESFDVKSCLVKYGMPNVSAYVHKCINGQQTTNGILNFRKNVNDTCRMIVETLENE